MPYLTLEDRRLHYRESGRGRPLVLLHPFPLHSGGYSPQLGQLGERCRTIAPDFRGFGQSTPGPGPSTMEELASDVLALLDALSIDRAVVGGVSMGGYVALALLRLDPTRVSGLALISTHARADDEQVREGREATARKVLAEGIGVLVESMLPRLLAPSASGQLREAVSSMILENTPAGAAAALRGMALRTDSREILSRYAGPTVIVSGEADAIVPADRAREMAGLVAGAEHIAIPGVGHLTQLEAPAAVNEALWHLVERGLTASVPG